MKEKPRPKPSPQKPGGTEKIPRDISFKASTSNLFLNIIIIVLGFVIIFLVYSLVTKLQDNSAIIIPDNQAPAQIVQLEVLNGCGAGGVADKFTDFLRRKDFDVVQVGNYISFDIDETMVIDRTGNKANAIKVAEALGIDKSNVIQQINNDYFLDVSLIIGKDYNRFKLNK
ncbi:MAG: LytR C-terminal domain-containing protein [Ignavibacteriaceae bacterium]